MIESGIIEKLNSLDCNITSTLNYDGGLFQDYLWTVFSSSLVWTVPALALIAFLVYKKLSYKQILIVVVALALVITLCDQFTSSLLKPLVGRLRPSHTPGLMDVLHYVGEYRGGRYGFPSSHAANSFGATMFVSLLVKRRWVTIALVLLTLCVCYSRIYLGVHFFGDIVVGGLIGCTFGYVVYLWCPVKLYHNKKLLAS